MDPLKARSVMPCPYWEACQQLIKLHVFELNTDLGYSYTGHNILIVDSDTVWSRDVTFVNGTDGKVTSIGVDNLTPKCNEMDPVQFTEATTAGPHLPTPP